MLIDFRVWTSSNHQPLPSLHFHCRVIFTVFIFIHFQKSKMARKVYVSCLKQVYCEGCLVLVVFTLALYSAVLTRNLVFLPSCGLGQHYQDFGHGFSPYGLPNWHISWIKPKYPRAYPTSFPGSLILPPIGASEERPWHTLVTCLQESGRWHLNCWRDGWPSRYFVSTCCDQNKPGTRWCYYSANAKENSSIIWQQKSKLL